MFLEHATLVLAGVVMVAVAGFVMYLARPREGKPAFFLVRSEIGSTFLIISLMTLAVFGVGLVLKGFVS
ncbi:MAG TPA: hypothetical protein VFV74_10925 [Burkholderiales bacterium]|nr:hypothetical protein [Burkholderiales bacterium]